VQDDEEPVLDPGGDFTDFATIRTKIPDIKNVGVLCCNVGLSSSQAIEMLLEKECMKHVHGIGDMFT